MTDEMAAELEKALAKNPDDLETVAKLIGFYSKGMFFDKEMQKKHAELALGIFKNYPSHPLAGSSQTDIYRRMWPESYAKAHKIWTDHLENSPENPRIIQNASNFFETSSPDEAQELLERGRKLEPKNVFWPNQLGNLYARRRIGNSDPNPLESAKKELAYFEEVLILTNNKSVYFMDCGNAAFYAEDYKKARMYAEKALASEQGKRNWNTGNNIHKGNCILGLIALKSGNKQTAKSYLLAAGKCGGSPQLNSFGPNMTLASALYDAGKKKAVKDYLKLVKTFWEPKTIDEMLALIKDGQKPEFKVY